MPFKSGGNVDTKTRLAQNNQKLQEIQSKLQQLEQTKQELLQELLRLDGENRLLLELDDETQIEG